MLNIIVIISMMDPPILRTVLTKIPSEHFFCVDNFGVITMLSFRCNFGRINPYKSHWNPIAQSVIIIIILRVSRKKGVLVGMLKARHSSYGCPLRLG